MQKCFESRDIGSLQEAVAKMPEEEAKYHMKRCVDSGLWVPEGGKATKAETSETNETDAAGTSASDSKTSTSTEYVD